MLADEAPEVGVRSPHSLNGSAVSFVLEVEDVDGAVTHAVESGAHVDQPVRYEPYGRIGVVIDPCGHRWSMMHTDPAFDATHAG